MHLKRPGRLGVLQLPQFNHFRAGEGLAAPLTPPSTHTTARGVQAAKTFYSECWSRGKQNSHKTSCHHTSSPSIIFPDCCLSPRSPGSPSPSPPQRWPEGGGVAVKVFNNYKNSRFITEEFTTNNISPYKGKINFSSNSGLAPAWGRRWQGGRGSR